MNETIKLLQSHRSVREFDPEKDVSEDMLKEIIRAALAAPNWMNGQQVSIIVVRDPEKKSQMAQATGNQRWIEEAPVFLVFCIDYYRAKLACEKHGTDFQVVNNLEAVMIGSTDVGIALGTAVIAAESLGLGTVPIGAVRKTPSFCNLLDPPEYVFPVGLVITTPRYSQQPRLPMPQPVIKSGTMH